MNDIQNLAFPYRSILYHIYQSIFSGSLSACDSFVNTFEQRGLRREVVCPCAHSSAALTVAIRR